jgi:hypothetical protein
VAALSAFALAVALGLLGLQVGGDPNRVALALVVGLLWFVLPFMAGLIAWASADELRPMLGPPLTRLLLANAVVAPALHLVAIAWAFVFLITR